MRALFLSVLLSFTAMATVDEAKLAQHRTECAAGKPEWCAGLGQLEERAGRGSEAKIPYEKACQGGLALSCRARGMIARAEGDRAGTLKYLEAACQHSSRECPTLNEYKLAIDDEPKFPAMKKSCLETGDKVCNVLAMRLTNLGRQKEALEIYQMGCEKGNIEACSWGAMFFPPEEAKKMRTRACELGSGRACEDLAGDDKALKEQLLQKGCDKGLMDLCYYLGMHIFYQAKKIEAKALLKKACENGHKGACMNIPWMDRQK